MKERLSASEAVSGLFSLCPPPEKLSTLTLGLMGIMKKGLSWRAWYEIVVITGVPVYHHSPNSGRTAPEILNIFFNKNDEKS